MILSRKICFVGHLPGLNPSQLALLAAQDQFVLEWGRMSSSWGINRTMAQIHALLLITGTPHTVDEIMDRLVISRGNASMSLRNLMEWGIVQRFRRPGDRKDTYLSESDPWSMFARVARERKRREIDPTVSAIHECLNRVPSEANDAETTMFRDRLGALLGAFSVIDAFFSQVFKDDDALRQTIDLFRGPRPKARE